MTATPWGPGRPAPLLDQDRAAILEDIAPKAAAPRGGAVDGDKRMPLEGVRILDFTRVRSGPTGTSILANYGAQVIKIESNTIDTFRNIELRTPQLDTLHRDKESIQLNLKDPRARDLFLDLAKQSDVVIENFTYKVMDDLGLSYEELRQAKPDIILAGMPPLGKTGPFAWWTTYGQQLMGLSGMSYLWGYPDSPMEAHPKIPYPDDTAAAQLVFAVMAALEHRDRTGEGQYIEIAQVEGLAFLLAPAYMDYLINGREWGPLGNVHPVAAPFGVYGAQGYDAWVAVSCETEDHWRALVAAMGAADWVQDERFSTRSGRREHKGDLDAYLEEWTSQRTPRQAMWELQMARVPAFEVPNNEDLYYDLHLRDRGFLTRGSFPGFEDAEYREALVALSESPGRVRKGAPVEGADNYEIFGDLLGLSKEEVDRLVEEKVIH